MIPELRKQYNQNYTEEKYQSYIDALKAVYPNNLDFRVAETPVFVPRDFEEKMLSACEAIIDVVSTPEYFGQSENAIPAALTRTNMPSW